MKKIEILLFFALISLLSLSAKGKGEAEPQAQLPTTGTIIYLEGDVFINGIVADFGDEVLSSQTLSTGSHSYCEVVFDDKNIFTLEENTTTVIDWPGATIQLEQGAMAALFTKLDKVIGEGRDFTVQTPTVAAGIRGTAFFVKVEDADNSYLCICNGALHITGNELDKGIGSYHHKAYRFTTIEGVTTWKSAALIYHDDSKMDGVAQKIGESIPWSEEEYY